MKSKEFTSCILCHSNYLRAFAMKLTGSADLSQDLVQDTIYRALANEDKFHGGNIRAWLGTIMRNLFINELRKKKRAFVAKNETENSFVLETNSHSARNMGDSAMMLEEVEKEIERLHPDLKAAFLMRFQGYKYDEIAEHFDAPLGTIKSRIHLARKNLKQNLGIIYGSQHLAELAA